MNKNCADVTVHIFTTQTSEEDTSEIKKQCCGKMFCSGDSSTVFYKDGGDDYTITVKSGIVTVSRSGSCSSRIVYEIGQTYKANYVTPYGSIPIVVKPHEISTEIGDCCGGIVLLYTLSVSGQIFENKVVMTIEKQAIDDERE